jgi:PPM family protein phosphatase
MELEMYCLTDPGQVREHNEDSVAHDPLAGFVVLADGMGGYNAGEVASGMATAYLNAEVPRLLKQKTRWEDLELRQMLQDAASQANIGIYNAANSNPQYSGMGTTLVLAVFVREQIYVGHVGDSRAYRFRDGQLTQVSRDHSLLQEQLDLGLITPEQAEKSSNKNLVTRALGVDPQVELEVNAHALQVDDIVLICSDGLTDMLNDADIQRVLVETGFDLEATAKRLVFKANEAGGRDNISVILVKTKINPMASGRFISRLTGWLKQ